MQSLVLLVISLATFCQSMAYWLAQSPSYSTIICCYHYPSYAYISGTSHYNTIPQNPTTGIQTTVQAPAVAQPAITQFLFPSGQPAVGTLPSSIPCPVAGPSVRPTQFPVYSKPLPPGVKSQPCPANLSPGNNQPIIVARPSVTQSPANYQPTPVAQPVVAQFPANYQPTPVAQPVVAQFPASNQPTPVARPVVAQFPANNQPTPVARPVVAQFPANNQPVPVARPSVAQFPAYNQPSIFARPAMARSPLQRLQFPATSSTG